MKSQLGFLLAALVLLPAAAQGEPTYQPYTARYTVFDGSETSRWTHTYFDSVAVSDQGEPLWWYKVLGVISDRETKPLHKDPVRAAVIAKLVRAAGGHAAVMLEWKGRDNQPISSGLDNVPFERGVTKYAVVRYLWNDTGVAYSSFPIEPSCNLPRPPSDSLVIRLGAREGGQISDLVIGQEFRPSYAVTVHVENGAKPL